MNKELSLILTFDFAPVLAAFSLFDIGQNKPYFNTIKTEETFAIWYENTIKEELTQVISLCESQETPLAIYFSGDFLEMLQQHDLIMLQKLKTVVDSGFLTLLAGTYHNSASSIYSESHFLEEIDAHIKLLKTLFATKAKYFYNTENIYCTEITEILDKKGFKGTFAGTIEWYLGKDKNQRIFHAANHPKQKIFLLDTDEGTALFSDPDRNNHFLQFDAHLIKQLGGIKSIIFKARNKAALRSLAEQISQSSKTSAYNIKSPVISGTHHMSLESIHSNALQSRTLKQYYQLESAVQLSKDKKLKQVWSQLGNIEYIIQMSKDEHRNHLPYDFYNHFMNILNDLEIRLQKP
ncbi:hypothetical protein N6H18_09470 [Reichenbachiella agarivorans]|uniref:Glycoside hydrolase family 57 N-terminal domain-containing protein n=1 Tax=Reichenbachiella agarivorans TaxID=2979464 RepID=A0ABY6CJD2_9BACT|nr:hypothetical protein [Reichenbachiella agarivorans]UXP30582.1 hypothetical protein N6H18_09470 [Reichenbachiella agarivorans]